MTILSGRSHLYFHRPTISGYCSIYCRYFYEKLSLQRWDYKRENSHGAILDEEDEPTNICWTYGVLAMWRLLLFLALFRLPPWLNGSACVGLYDRSRLLFRFRSSFCGWWLCWLDVYIYCLHGRRY